MLGLFQNEFAVFAPPEPPIFSAGSELSRSATTEIINATGPSAWVDVYYPVLNL